MPGPSKPPGGSDDHKGAVEGDRPGDTQHSNRSANQHASTLTRDSPGNPSPAGAEFSVALENTGDSDFVVNLGSMLGNGKVMFPTAVRLILTDLAGKTRELEFFDRRYPGVGGRVDPFTVSLRAGSIYVLRTTLNQYVIPATNNFDVKLASGRNRIAARFEGQGVEGGNSDMRGVALLNFWKGTAQSNTVEFDVPDPK